MSDELIVALAALLIREGLAFWERSKAHVKLKRTREQLAAVIDGVDSLDGEEAERAKEKIQEKAKACGVEPVLNDTVKTRRLERRRYDTPPPVG